MILIRFDGKSCILQAPNGRQISLRINSSVDVRDDWTQIRETKGKVFIDGKELK